MKNILFLLLGLLALNFKNQAQTLSDVDGNKYNTVTIGTQTWMKENLKTTTFNDNVKIPLITNNISWKNLITPAFCTYNNTLNVDTINTYGRLYNWYTINTKKLCPTGWHVPTINEWDTLIFTLDTSAKSVIVGVVSEIASDKLKEIGTTHWSSPNTGATNESDFTALPSGNRFNDGIFYSIGDCGGWWSSTESSKDYTAFFYGMYYNFSDINKGSNFESCGFAVRCIKDSELNNINDIFYNNIKLYPNPSTDKLTVVCSEKENKIYIYNLIGILVFKGHTGNNLNEIDLSNLQTGIYVIKIENEIGTIQQKLIKK